MKIRAARLTRADGIGVAVALLVVGGGYLSFIQGPLREGARLTEARATYARVTRELADVQAGTERLRQCTEAGTKKLAMIGGGLPEPREVDRYLARLTTMAEVNGIVIDTLIPMPAREREDHWEVHINFVGRGPFMGFHRMLHGIERDLEYADVTNFSIVSGGPNSESPCRVEWSLRICTSRETTGTKAGAAPGSGRMERTVSRAESP